MFAFKLKDTMHNASNAKEHKLHISKINFLYINYYNYRKHRIEWFRGLWAYCANVDSPVSLGLFEGENKSIYFQKSLPQLCM